MDEQLMGSGQSITQKNMQLAMLRSLLETEGGREKLLDSLVASLKRRGIAMTPERIEALALEVGSDYSAETVEKAKEYTNKAREVLTLANNKVKEENNGTPNS